ncbi:MAG: GtrA family protein [Oscillospiraceae bacterium]|jgi:putative flippase GtrA|nr:GtrA family protein [Oscillospiraceae bacterium]
MKKFLQKHRELLLYILFGVLTTIVNMVVFQLMEIPGRRLLGNHSFWLSNPVAWVAAVAFAYLTNKLFVFGQKSWQPRVIARELSAFVAARLLSLAMEQGLMALLFDYLQPKVLPRLTESWLWPLWHESLHLPGEPESVYRFCIKLVFIQALVVILNYIFSKLFIFKKKPEAQG